MNCLRCGRETPDDHAFCDHCLETMKKYPVRPGTAVILPRHKETTAARKNKRHSAPAPKDQIRGLKKQRAFLWAVVMVLLLALLGAAGRLLYVSDDQTPKPGQNYVVVETSSPQ